MSQVSFKPAGLDRERLRSLIAERKLDGLLLSSPENVFYTTGYPALPSSGNPIIYALRNQLPFFAFVSKEGAITLLAWGGAAMGIDYGADDVRMFFSHDMAVAELTGLCTEVLRADYLLGVESTLPYFAYEVLQYHAQPPRLVIADDILQRLRLIKTAAEVARIRQSTATVDQTVLELAHGLRLGMTRLELIHDAKVGLLRNGADGVGHVTVAFGSANPEVALDEALERNQIVTLDLGAVYGGYASDNRRLVYTGAAPAALKELHGKMCWVVAEMGRYLRPGRTFSDVHAHAFDLYAAVGLEPMFLHAGHSIGLQVEEHWILADDPTPVQPGMVLNIELYSPSDEGVMVGDEETFLVTDGEPERLSSLPVDIIERSL
jgi:Xaa-Pro aminopeptidase